MPLFDQHILYITVCW